MNKDSLGNRMKDYENVSRLYLTKRTPVIIRVDGKAFHSYTRDCKRPFDKNLIECMIKAVVQTFQEIQGCKLAYVQSDEASFLLTDYDDIDTQGWFNYNLSKMVSISAAVMTANFNKYASTYLDNNKIAYFDSRAFNIPREDVVNYFLWRAKDWRRNSLQMYCRNFFSHKELNGKNRDDMIFMLSSIGKDWNRDLEPYEKNGTFIRYGGSRDYDVTSCYESINKYLENNISY